jgi:hypothetical protein
MANEIDKQLEEAAKTLKPAFKQVVDSLADSNKEVALTAANFRNSSRDSFKGALAAQKMRDTLTKVADGLKSGEGQLGNIDFAEFKKVSETTQQLEEQLAKAQKARADRLATAEKKNNDLGKKDIEIAALKEKQSRLQGQALNNATEALKQAEKEREEQKTRILAAKDREVKEAEVALEKEKKSRDNYNKELEGILKATNDESGKRLGEFSDGLKELTSFDLMDSFDSVVKKINGVGMLFGNQDLFGDVVGGLQNFASATGSALSSLSSSVMAGLSATGTYFSGIGETFKEGGLSAVTEQLNADLGKVWGSMKEGAGNMMKGIKGGFDKGVASLQAGFTAFKAGSMNILRGMKTFLASTATLLVGLVTAGASLVATGVSMLAAALGLSVPALLIGALALLLIGGAIYLYNSSEGFRAAVDTVVGYFMDIISTIGDIFGGFYDFFVGLFTGDFDMMFQGIKDIFGGLWDLLLAPFRAIGDFFKNVFDIDIGKMLRGMAEKILPGWLVNRLFGEETSEPPMEEAPANQKAMERGAQPTLSVDEIDQLSTEDQVRLGYANVTGYSEEAMVNAQGEALLDEDGNQRMREFATYESSEKYRDALKAEGVTSGGGFSGTASGSVAEEIAFQESMKQARGEAESYEIIGDATQSVRDGEKKAMNQAVVTTINAPTTNASNTNVKSVNPTPRDTDPTGSRLSAVPA